jgi:hypothetical protein
MDNYIDKLVNDPLTAETEEITALLNEELSKPAHERDYEKINELTEAYTVLIGVEDEIATRSASGIEALEIKVQKNKPHIHVTKRIKVMLTAGIAAAVMLVSNTISVAAFQKDIFTLIVEYAQTSFSIKRPENAPYTGQYAGEVKRVDDLPATPDDPYGIKAECAKHGLDVLAPTYLPEGFELYDCDYSESKVTNYQSMSFWFYRNESQIAKFTYKLLPEDGDGSGIPSDQFNLHEIDIHGIPAIVSEEDGQYTAIFYNGNLETIITTDSGYENGDKIVASLK